MSSKVNKSKSKFSLFYIAVLTIAIISLSKFFGAAQYFQVGEDWKGILQIAISVPAFVISMTYLAFRVYMEEKQNDNLRKNFFFFDWLESKFYPIRKQEG